MKVRAFITFQPDREMEYNFEHREIHIPEHIDMTQYDDYIRDMLSRDWKPEYSDMINVQYCIQYDRNIYIRI